MAILKNSRALRAISLLLIMATLYSIAHGKVIYVDDDANGVTNGTTWANAFRYLQDAIADAYPCNEQVEIRVAQGTYVPDRSSANPEGTGDRKAYFRLYSGILLVGGYAGPDGIDPNTRDVKNFETILSGDLAFDDDVHDQSGMLSETT